MEIDKTDLEVKEGIKAIVAKGEHKMMEICGIAKRIDGQVICVQVPNDSATPEVTYHMNPQLLAKATKDTNLFGGGKGEFIGIWHTHPYGPDGPSGMDTNEMLFEKNYYVYVVKSGVFAKFKKENAPVIKICKLEEETEYMDSLDCLDSLDKEEYNRFGFV